jgi:hypothetical protein
MIECLNCSIDPPGVLWTRVKSLINRAITVTGEKPCRRYTQDSRTSPISGHLARIVPDNPIAFPPSVEVSGVTGLDYQGDSNAVRVGYSYRSPGKRGRHSVRRTTAYGPQAEVRRLGVSGAITFF